MSKFIWFCKEKEIPKQKKAVEQQKKSLSLAKTGMLGTTHDMIE